MGLTRNLLIHHHATVFVDPETGFWYTYSFIGRWINEIARHCEQVGLLLHVVSTRNARHDTRIEGNNIELISLGAPGRYTDRFEKIRRIKNACRSAAPRYDSLLIRGITPRQMTIFDNTPVEKKFFLLVGSLIDGKPAFSFSFVGIVQFLLFYIRLWELKKIAKTGHFLGNSPVLIQEIKEKLGVEAHYIPTNTICDAEVAPLADKPLQHPVRLVFCGRLVADKGIYELAEALNRLLQSGLECRLVFVGEPAPGFVARLKEMPYWPRIENAIAFTGFVRFGPELFRQYAEADFYVLPSWHEGFPHSIWESASVSTPVLTTPVGGIPGLLSDREVFWIQPRDPDSIVTVLRQAISNPDLRRQKTQNLYEILLKNTLEKGVERLMEVLNKQTNTAF